MKRLCNGIRKYIFLIPIVLEAYTPWRGKRSTTFGEYTNFFYFIKMKVGKVGFMFPVKKLEYSDCNVQYL